MGPTTPRRRTNTAAPAEEAATKVLVEAATAEEATTMEAATVEEATTTEGATATTRATTETGAATRANARTEEDHLAPARTTMPSKSPRITSGRVASTRTISTTAPPGLRDAVAALRQVEDAPRHENAR